MAEELVIPKEIKYNGITNELVITLSNGYTFTWPLETVDTALNRAANLWRFREFT